MGAMGTAGAVGATGDDRWEQREVWEQSELWEQREVRKLQEVLPTSPLAKKNLCSDGVSRELCKGSRPPCEPIHMVPMI